MLLIGSRALSDAASRLNTNRQTCLRVSDLQPMRPIQVCFSRRTACPGSVNTRWMSSLQSCSNGSLSGVQEMPKRRLQGIFSFPVSRDLTALSSPKRASKCRKRKSPLTEGLSGFPADQKCFTGESEGSGRLKQMSSRRCLLWKPPVSPPESDGC